MITLQRCNALNYALNNQYRNTQQLVQPKLKGSLRPVKSAAEGSSDSIFKIIFKAISNIF